MACARRKVFGFHVTSICVSRKARTLSRHDMSSSRSNDRAPAPDQLAGTKRPAADYAASASTSASEHVKRPHRRPISPSSRKGSDGDRALFHGPAEPTSPALSNPQDASRRPSLNDRSRQTDYSPLSRSATGLTSPSLENHPRSDDRTCYRCN